MMNFISDRDWKGEKQLSVKERKIDTANSENQSQLSNEILEWLWINTWILHENLLYELYKVDLS